jgi:integrase
MASVNFYLEKRKGQDGRLRRFNIPVLLYFSYDGKRLQINTGERTDLEKWDFRNQKIVEEAPHSEQINACLASLGNKIMNIYREAMRMGIKPGNEYLRDRLKNRKTHIGFSFFEIYMKFIEENNEKWSIHTFRKIKTNYRHLRDFSEKSGYIIDLDRINENFYRKYIEYFREKEHSNTTIVRNLNILKWYLNWATRKGYNNNFYYRDFRFPWEHSYKSALTDQYLGWDELISLFRSEISEISLCKARDVFCFLCFTGLKHSQLRFLRISNDINNNISFLKPESQIIQFSGSAKYLQEILGRYNKPGSGKKFLPVISNVELNRRIKAAGKIAGIDQPVKIQICSGNEKLTRNVPKYKLLSTKVAGNTFIFHSLRLGLPLQYILRMTGLKTFYGINKFYNLSNTDVADKPEVIAG